MTVTIDFPPDIKAGLIAQPQAEGLEVADYVRNLVRKDIAQNGHAGSQPAQPEKKRNASPNCSPFCRALTLISAAILPRVARLTCERLPPRHKYSF